MKKGELLNTIHEQEEIIKRKNNNIDTLYSQIEEKDVEIGSLVGELIDLYEYLYPNTQFDSKLYFQMKGNLLMLWRDHHKKQLEKEKMKKLIKECIKETK